jgi:hypothetical protein
MPKQIKIVLLIVAMSSLTLNAQTIGENELRITTPSAPWTIVISGTDLDIKNVGLKPGATSLYVLMADETRDLNVSFYIEPAEKCKTSEACSEYVLGTGNPAWGKYQDLTKGTIDGVSYFEFYRPVIAGKPIKMQDMYAQYVSMNYWVDLHISKVLYEKGDKKHFEDVVKSLKFVPKSSPPDTGAKLTSELQKIADAWLSKWDAGRCKETYAELTTISRGAVSEAQWIEYCQSIRAATGTNTSRKMVAASLQRSLPGKPDHSGATFRFESTFKNHPLGPEFVSMTREKDGRWTVSHYVVQ